MVCFKKMFIYGDFLKTTSKFYSIEKKSVGFVKFIFEAYDGIAVVETVDRQASIIKLHIAPGCEGVVDDVLNELKKEIFIEPVSEVADQGAGNTKKTI